ncbi:MULTISPECIES: DNA-directed RNA polymerase subunit alpha [Helicobacter]|uniref:DNA-directed RNA polymerase subunit alpha n=1 Tax=Helicobacter macacae MIT 99-5501 TaxID=1357400 RepID=V8C9D9_9HELI|nr:MULTISPECIES: DNA-directed RNA polymerase subunit alpha [Helicobacter]ETD23366.1 DNA-directed RNA polymerase, alpha subunit [Helicobacter macacae MIT 99-5501]RDU53818.1 DNA-directed RNA polymerase subunit alpha [Helicobacter sp. MIT 01-3238]
MDIFKTVPHIPNEILVEDIGTNRIRVSVWPFEPGYAITFAHPLRRLMLSCTPGYAPVMLHIDGVSHEFDSMRGVVEDVTPFIMHLKKIRFASKSKELQNTIRVNYNFKGPMELKGAHLVTDEIDVVNKEAHLATINEDAKFSFSLVVKRSIGFKPNDLVRKDKDFTGEIGLIPLDAHFTPVKKVIYEIQDVLVDDNPNYEKVVFEIESDGQVEPLDVFKNSIAIAQAHMNIFGSEVSVLNPDIKFPPDDPIDLKTLLIKIDTLNLSTRCFHCLDKIGVQYIGELAMMPESTLKGIKNMGKKSFDEIAEKLSSLGYPIGSNLPPEVQAAFNKKIGKTR